MSPKATIILTSNQVVQIVRHDASKDVEILRRGFRTTLDQEHYAEEIAEIFKELNIACQIIEINHQQ